jgi:hypothetical protein
VLVHRGGDARGVDHGRWIADRLLALAPKRCRTDRRRVGTARLEDSILATN